MIKYCYLPLIILITSCSGTFDIELEKNAVKVFHEKFNLNNADEIIFLTTDEFKKSDSKDNIAAYFNGVYKKLGKNVDSKLINWHVFIGTAGKEVQLGYESKFENGNAMEQFTLREKDGQALIQHYDIQSKVFITGS